MWDGLTGVAGVGLDKAVVDVVDVLVTLPDVVQQCRGDGDVEVGVGGVELPLGPGGVAGDPGDAADVLDVRDLVDVPGVGDVRDVAPAAAL